MNPKTIKLKLEVVFSRENNFYVARLMGPNNIEIGRTKPHNFPAPALGEVLANGSVSNQISRIGNGIEADFEKR